MSGRIKQLFSLSHDLNGYTVLEAARKKILKNKNNDSRSFTDLEELLNQLYLNKENNYLDQQLTNNAVEGIKQWIEDQIIKIDIDEDEDEQKNFTWKYKGSRKNAAKTKSIRSSTVFGSGQEVGRLKQIEKSLEIIEKELQSIDPSSINRSKATLEKLKNDGEQLKNQLLSIKEGETVEGAFLSKSKKSIMYGENSSFNINFNKLYKKLLKLNNLTQIYGEALERGLTLFSDLITSAKNDITVEMIKEMLSKIETEGAKSGKSAVNRGTFSTTIFSDADLNSFNSEFMGRFQKGYHEAITTKNFNINTAFDSSKKGKVDVIFKLPNLETNTTDTFRISAKSWQYIKDIHNNFGKTSLLYAMMRTVNFDKTIAYGLVLGYYRDKTYYRFHTFARACALVDIVMGYSQDNNYADTIVVQDRSKPQHPIRVFSIAEIFNNIAKMLKSSEIDYIEGYDYDVVITGLDFRAADRFKNYSYRAEIYSFLKNIELRVTAGILDLK